MSSVEIVIPYAAAGCTYRASVLSWLLDKLTGRDVTIANAVPWPWVKASAVMPAVRRSTADVVVLHDADVFTAGLDDAIRAVELGAGWAIPHGLVHRLTRESTDRVLAGEAWEGLELERRAYHGVPGGGVLVAPRQRLLDVPMDPRFHGWGQEDESHAMALWTLVGQPWRGESPLVHLWHTPQPRMNRRQGSVAGWQLCERYIAARQDPDRMRALVEEAR